ncbi:hypothetical protein JDV02_007761 [Purpureocillium takamizusanense]|uniref:HTH APSES-type domain-containing protein n=1 Tax=Purpureocillium takamizusanense TaxID=2060973 RepID=A0A9Q8QLB2_9HYPO|nr:uncharacterized protein JDV02_007761 [Purpureocillium takamizusanense]UNI21805.1 hypothetical protein JDV02_007761 [Purpureocillium takamizusanense]
MLPLRSLLNPDPPDRRSDRRRLPAHALPMASARETQSTLATTMEKHRLPSRRGSRNAAYVPRSKTQGPVRYPPFEDVSDAAAREVAKYEIDAFGYIQQCCEHIPYNSTKKDFFEKTGRESIEAFSYEFRIPGQQLKYKVMWDYNIGLVRMTPFFKSLGYAKTKPSQMLDKNPGLRDISPSITGGSVGAQGYWMPFRCARAVCATFCYDIAGALIPLFGPEFPMECIPATYPEFGEMIINQQLVMEATMEAEASRDAYLSRKATTQNGLLMYVPHDSHRAARGEELHPYLRPGGFSPWTPIRRNNSGARPVRHELFPPHGHRTTRTYPYAGGVSLPPIHPRQEEAQSQGPISYWDPLHRDSIDAPATAFIPGDWERRYAGASAPEPRPGFAAFSSSPAREDAAATRSGKDEKRTGNGLVADYAAAATLVRLQTEDQEAPGLTDGPAPVGSQDSLPGHAGRWTQRPGRARSC